MESKDKNLDTPILALVDFFVTILKIEQKKLLIALKNEVINATNGFLGLSEDVVTEVANS